jgi:hypothetical protein
MKTKFTKTNFLQLSQDALDFQLKSLYPISTKKDPMRINLVFLNHDRNFSTFLTIKYLTEHERVADIYSLSRSMFESIISMGLISKYLVKDDLERYQDYQYIETYKTYNHLKKLGLERLSGVSPSDLDSIFNKRNEYLKKWGKSINTWTGKSLEQNVKTVDSAYNPTCKENHFYEYLYCQVYRKGSQAIHSSFAGLAKGVDVERVVINNTAIQEFKTNEAHLIFSCFHSLLVFLSSVRFLGYLIDNNDIEKYFQNIANYIISDE